MRPHTLFIAFLGGLSAVVACAAAAPPPAQPAAYSALTGTGAPAAISDLDASLEASAPSAAPGGDASAHAEPDAASSTSPAAETSTSACNEQSPQDFLVRGNFLKTPGGNDRAIQYRTDTYGFFPGFGRPAQGARPASASVVDVTFMGLPVKMHRKVAPALACVEEEIKRSCADHPYTAHALAGIRFKNTYRGGEVTNHAFGIAIDVDPSLNTCCGCVKPWNDAPRCRRPAKTEYDRMEMPECWVHAFERYGFYWLGHDVLQDTMHYEFLGDPDRILKASAATPPPTPPVGWAGAGGMPPDAGGRD
jgi:hypothetical protein